MISYLFILYAAALILLTLIYNTNPVYVKELFSWVFLFVSIVTIISMVKKKHYIYKKLFAFDFIIPVLFAVFVLVWNLSNPKSAEIIQYRTLLRLSFVVFVITHFYITIRKEPGILYLIGILFTFNTLPFVTNDLPYFIGSLIFSFYILFRTGMVHKSGLVNNRYSFINNKYSFIAILLFLGILVSMSQSTLWIYGVRNLVRVSFGVVVYIFIRGIAKEKNENIEKIAGIIIFAIGINILYAIYGVISSRLLDPNFIPFLIKKKNLAGLNTNDLGGLFSMTFPFLALGFVFSSKKNIKYATALAALLSIALILISWSRTSFIALGLSIVLLPVFIMSMNKKSNPIKLLLIGSSFLILAILAGIHFLPEFTDNSQVKILTSTETVESRLALWGLSFTSILKYPVVGSGPGNSLHLLSFAYPEIPWKWLIELTKEVSGSLAVSHSHDIFIEVLMTGGLVTFLPFVALIFISLLNGLKNLFEGSTEKSTSGHKWQISAAFALIIYLFHSLANYTLFLSTFTILFYALLALSSVRLSHETSNETTLINPDGKLYRLRRYLIVVSTVFSLIIFAWIFTGYYYYSRTLSGLRSHLIYSQYLDYTLIPSTISLNDEKGIQSRISKDPFDENILGDSYRNISHALRIINDQHLHSLAGDIRYIQYLQNRNPENFTASLDHYLICTNTKGSPVYCLKRIDELETLAEQNGMKISETRHASWKEKDPHKIILRKNILVY